MALQPDLLRYINGKSRLLAISLATFLTIVTAGQVDAQVVQQTCVARDDMVRQLESKYKERPNATGLSSNGYLLELFMTDTGSTWSIIISFPNGQSCIVDAGEHWRWRAPRKPLGDDT